MPTKQTYPAIGAKSWYAVRSKASSSPTTKFTDGTVSAILDMSSAKSARDNVVRPLTQLGIIDENGVLTELGHQWRVDDTYEAACAAIASSVFPEALQALTDDDGKPDQEAVLRWFLQQGFGESSARQMARMYDLLAQPDATPPEPSTRETAPKRDRPRRKPRTKNDDPPPQAMNGHDHDGERRGGNGGVPPLHLDVQIHIPADASLEQIDRIFSSMAKHLYGRE